MREPSDRGSADGQWRNWAGDEGCRPRAIVCPQSIEQIAYAVGRAADEGWRVRVVGAGHSFSDIACTDGMLLSLERFGDVLDVDRDSGLVRVQGGITIAALNGRLAEHGLAMENLGDIDVQSIAGAISTATHGTGARLRNIPSQVQELKLVLADGSTLVCSDGNAGERSGDGADGDGANGDGSEGCGSELLRAARVGLGALGVVAEVTLRCVPAFTLRGIDAPAPLQETLERFDELANANEHFEFFVFPHCDVALTRTNNRTDEEPRPRGKAAAWCSDVLLTNHAFGAFCALGRALPSQIPRINRLVTKLAGSSKRIDRSDRIFASPRLVRFTEMEYSLPRERTPEAVRAVMELIERRGFAVPFPIEVRTVAPDDAMLSTAYGRESGFVAVHMYRGMQWRPYFEAVERIMYELGGRPHWGKRHFQTAETLRPRYPEWDAFQAIRARLDPDGRFANAWTDRVLGPVSVPAPA
ncbi:MAG TPA: D-arabinono-1,4-lactone oxidase [Solirubrobacteraceae bacterium]|jgi:L-gulonolactone oxidase|nr:D-arabinono-1,4-lactone oxidase [Solirubrobacteraceae bacterium]